MRVEKPERDRHAAASLALNHEVRKALREAGADEQGGGGCLDHARTLQIVEALRKPKLYTLCKDTKWPPLQTVGMIGPKYPNKLRAWREKREMTQEQLAEAVGCSPASVGHWENGERRLTDKWLPKLAAALKTSSGYIIETDPDDVSADILEIWSQIPEENRAQALAVLQTFKIRAAG